MVAGFLKTPYAAEDELYINYLFENKTKAANAHEVMKSYLDRTVELCKERGVILVLISLPGNEMNDGINNLISSYAVSNGLDYYNLCETELYNSIGAVLPKENIVGHENIWGAIKMSRYFGGLLTEKNHVEPVKDDQFESTKEYYNHVIDACSLSHITDINEYLKAIKNDHYTVFISTRQDVSRGITEETLKDLKDLGLENDQIRNVNWSYCAVISPQSGVRENDSQNRPAVLSGSIRENKTFYTVQSCGKLAGAKSSIVIDGNEYCRNTRGLNIVVYDNQLLKVVDTVTFDPYKEWKPIRLAGS